MDRLNREASVTNPGAASTLLTSGELKAGTWNFYASLSCSAAGRVEILLYAEDGVAVLSRQTILLAAGVAKLPSFQMEIQSREAVSLYVPASITGDMYASLTANRVG
jgi:hypothetical protein